MPIAFITGVTGQDGTYLARQLLAEGVEVHGLVRPNSGSAVEQGVIAHEGNLRDAAALRSIVETLRPDELYHLGGQSSVAASWEDPVGTIADTGAPTAALLHAVADHSPHTRFVFAASAEIFGYASAPQNELTPVAPVSPYGAAKALGYFLVSGYRERGLHASSCVLYNHESPLRPERFVTRKITAAAARISRGRQETVSLGNLDVSRDWAWAPDVVDALRRAAAHSSPGDYVVGTGKLHTVRDFVIAAFAAAGIDDWESHVVIDDAFVRAVDPSVQLADSEKACAVLGWSPTVDFAELVTRMVNADLTAVDLLAREGRGDAAGAT
jgi:GDPmannose 4,6-dehydratase